MHGNHKAITVLGKLLNLQRCYFPVKQLCSTTLERIWRDGQSEGRQFDSSSLQNAHNTSRSSATFPKRCHQNLNYLVLLYTMFCLIFYRLLRLPLPKAADLDPLLVWLQWHTTASVSMMTVFVEQTLWSRFWRHHIVQNFQIYLVSRTYTSIPLFLCQRPGPEVAMPLLL